MKTALRLVMAASTVALATTAHAQSRSYTTPNITTATGAQSVTLGGQTFVNQGLVGAGRLAATTRDFAGETLGSFSGLALDLGSWRRNADGSYSGRMLTLPDRGPNDVGPFVGTTNYRNRVHTHNITLNPYTGRSNLPAATASQNQLGITPTGGFFLTDSTGQNFTGKDAGSNVITRGGILYPSPASGEGAGRISLDSEAIAYAPDGSFYVSDEYAAGIYHFDATGRQIGAIQAVQALLPKVNGTVSFDGATAPATGRRNNQGLEALAVTPSGSKLVTILQSATVQDTNGSNQQTRNNTRILVYDISSSATPANPAEHYVLQLPVFRNSGNGSTPDRTAAQSEMLALNDNQFLVLSRDGIGRGSGASPTNSPVYKSVLLVDTTGATNIAGTAYETGATPVATNGTLASGIAPVQQVELVNMLNPVQLGRFGLNLNTQASTTLSMSEKWEALGLVPVLDEAAPQDFFLLVGNDNDFMTSNGLINGQGFDASLSGAGGTGNNDSVILVYRLSLPTYVDPQALAALRLTTPYALAAARSTVASIGSLSASAAIDQLASQRRGGLAGFGTGGRFWVQGDWAKVKAPVTGGTRLSSDGEGAAVGMDFGFGITRLGASVAYQRLKGDLGAGFDLEAEGMSASIYGGVAAPNGFYAELALSTSFNLDLDRIARPAAYGTTATGRTDAKATTAIAEIGWLAGFGALRVGPFAAVEYIDAKIDGYTEFGAALSNAAVPDINYERTRATLGLEARGPDPSPIVPSVRVGYTFENESGDKEASLRLASANHANATALVALPGTERDHVTAAGALDGKLGALGWRLGVEGRFGDGETDGRAFVGIAAAF